MTKFINTYINNAAFTADTNNFSYPHVGYLQTEDEVKYNETPGDFNNIWGTVTDGTTSFSLRINNSNKSVTVNNGYFYYNWTGGTITNLNRFLYYRQPASKIKVSGLDTSSCTNMSNMFESSVYTKEIDIKGINTSSCTNMSNMFKDCRNLITLTGLEDFNTSNVTDMNNMFYYCQRMTTIDVSAFDTSNVTNMSSMFNYCPALTTIDVSAFDTSNVTNMNAMFLNDGSLQTIDLSNFNTEKVANIKEMFHSCAALVSLDLSGWELSAVTATTTSLFNRCNSLTSITMNNTSQTTLDVIKSGLENSLDSNNVIIASKVTIVRDGYNWNYVNGQWVSTPV